MKILPNHLNIACILVSSGYLVSKRNKDCVALPFVTAPPSSIQEVWACPGRKWRTWVILVHTEKKKNVNMLSKKGVNCCQGCEESIWGLVCVCGWVTISVSVLHVSANTCACFHDKGPLNRCCWRMSLNQVFISSLAGCSSFIQASVRRYIWCRSQWHMAIYVW